jgi:threonine synthase
VVVISTAHGLKFTDFKVGYHDRALADVAAQHANPPVELPADYDAVQRVIDARFNKT